MQKEGLCAPSNVHNEFVFIATKENIHRRATGQLFTQNAKNRDDSAAEKGFNSKQKNGTTKSK